MSGHFSNFNHRLIASVSLILLAGFLGYYIRSTYLSEEKDFNKEVKYIFTNAFRTAESKTLDKMIFELKGVSWLENELATNITVRNHKTEILTIDSVGMEEKSGGKATTIVIARNEISDESPSKMRLKMELRNDSIHLDTTHYLKSEKIGSNFAEIEKIFKENLQNSGLNIEYKIVKDSNSMDTIGSDVYKDVFTNEFYNIQTDHNQMFVLKRILPEIILSLLMYLVFIFAFVSIISSSRKQNELNNMQQDFVRNMTHELKTPIATMGVALEAIQNFHAGQDESVRQEYYRIAETENQKLNMLVDKVLSASQQMDSSGPKYERANLNELVSDVLESFKWRAELNGILVIFEKLSSEEAVELDVQKFILVLHNLIENALKYNKSKDPRVMVSMKRSENYLIVFIEDNGNPIKEEYIEKIFERFYRIPSGNIHDEKGHGLGLYIVKQLVKSLRGDIRLRTTEEGNIFELSIPVDNVA